MNRLLKFIIFLGVCCVLSLQFGLQAKAGIKPAFIVEAHWRLDEESRLNAYKILPHHAAALSNLKPAHAIKEYVGNPFNPNVFLPTSGEAAVGEVWAFDVSGVLPLLRQFHPGATVALSDKLGAFACLRALSPDYAEIIFQFHADFDLATVEVEEMLAVQKKPSFEKLRAFEKLQEELQEQSEEKFTAPQADVVKQFDDFVKAKVANLQGEKMVVEREPTLQKSELSELTEKLTALSATLTSLEEQLNDRLTTLEEKLSELSELTDKLIELSGILTQLDERLTALERKLDGKFTALEGKLDGKFTVLEEALTKQFESQLTVLEGVLTAREQRLTARLAQLTAIYFTPTHFTGRLLIHRNGGAVAAFSLRIPDNDENAMLSTFGHSVPVSAQMALIRKKDSVSPDEIKWSTAISVEETHALLQLKRPKQEDGRVQLVLPPTR